MDKEKDTLTPRLELRKLLEPGMKVYTILRHVSASGTSRRISVLYIDKKGHPQHLDWYLEEFGIAKRHKSKDGLSVSGCGMDMGYHLVYSLGRVLYPMGFSCAGEGCPSNDHANGNKRELHPDGGYAFRHEWL